MSAPQWTTTPPTEPGWYFVRWTQEDGYQRPIYYDADYRDRWAAIIENEELEFWPVRIPEPPR